MRTNRSVRPGSVALATVERYLDEVLNGRNPAASTDLVADESARQRVTALRAAFPDLLVEPNVMVAEDELVAVHLAGAGTHRGLFQGCPPTGRRWRATCTAVYRVDDGRIADAWVNWDWLSVMEQLACIRRVEGVSA